METGSVCLARPHLDMDDERTSVIGHRTQGSGIHHSNSGIQITHNMYINGYFTLLFDLTPDRGSSEPHTSLPENDYISIELLFRKPLPESITWTLYLEYNSTVLVNLARTVTTNF